MRAKVVTKAIPGKTTSWFLGPGDGKGSSKEKRKKTNWVRRGKTKETLENPPSWGIWRGRKKSQGKGKTGGRTLGGERIETTRMPAGHEQKTTRIFHGAQPRCNAGGRRQKKTNNVSQEGGLPSYQQKARPVTKKMIGPFGREARGLMTKETNHVQKNLDLRTEISRARVPWLRGGGNSGGRGGEGGDRMAQGNK